MIVTAIVIAKTDGYIGNKRCGVREGKKMGVIIIFLDRGASSEL
jgi:hypothetical protein